MSGFPAAADGPTFIVWRIAVNCETGGCGFETFGLRLDIFGQPLTNSYNRPVRRGEAASSDAEGVQSWPAMANAKTNGETEPTRNVRQLGSCGSTCGVNNMEGKSLDKQNLAPQALHERNSGLSTRGRRL